MMQTTEELITELAMTYSFRMHLIVEGDDDRRFFQSAMRGVDKVNLVCAWGSDNVMSVIREIDKLGKPAKISPTLGLVDRDYRVPLRTLLKSPNLITTDSRDLECMMFNSPSCEAVFSEFGSPQKITVLGGLAPIAEVAVAAAKKIGGIRYFCQLMGIGTSFQKLDLSKLADKKTLTMESGELIKHINARQGASGCTLPENAHELAVEACTKAQCDEGLPYFQHDFLLCRGHDLMELLAIGFRSLFGSRSATESSRENVELLFRLSYVAHFGDTQMGKAIDAWLAENSIAPHVSLR